MSNGGAVERAGQRPYRLPQCCAREDLEDALVGALLVPKLFDLQLKSDTPVV